MQLLLLTLCKPFRPATCLSTRSRGKLHAGASKRHATGFAALRWATISTLEFLIVTRRAYPALLPSWPCTCVCCCKACQFRTHRPAQQSAPSACLMHFPSTSLLNSMQDHVLDICSSPAGPRVCKCTVSARAGHSAQRPVHCSPCSPPPGYRWVAHRAQHIL